VTLSNWLSPPQLAELLAVDCKKILAFIATGELVAVNLAQRSNGRPRWRISPEALEQFLARRQSRTPSPRAARSRKKAANVVEFY
jgi:Helix-turn-helix domain